VRLGVLPKPSLLSFKMYKTGTPLAFAHASGQIASEVRDSLVQQGPGREKPL
jgi:hypothetical protein